MSAMCMSRFALAATVLTWAEERPKSEGTDRLVTTSSCRRLHYSSQILELWVRKKKVPANHDLHNAACSNSYSNGGCISSSCHWFDLLSWPKLGVGSTKYSSCNGLLIYLIVDDNISVYIYHCHWFQNMHYHFMFIVFSLFSTGYLALVRFLWKLYWAPISYFPAKTHLGYFDQVEEI